ncbi:MAG: transcription-repair coupling factor [bacterium]|nr:transcription-repair coupling factor [bacterium]MDE0288481.1 transcription-repair coupling factor [bacterium]MDE0439231.1 transcription-repair coupling factor [bacterium]
MPAPLSPLLDRWRPRHLPKTPGRRVVPASARALTLGGLSTCSEGPLLAVVPSEREAEALAADLRLFTDDVMLLPSWETLPFEHVSPNTGTMARRAEARRRLARGRAGLVVVASVRATVQRVSGSSTAPVLASAGAEVEFEGLVRRLDEAGYSRTDRVESRGEFAVRGGIVDVFPAQSDTAVRVDFWGDHIDEIRAFSVGSQRSMGQVGELRAYPAREFRPDRPVREAARALRSTEPWAYSIWDRIAEGVRFAGMESWLPWLTPARSLLHDLPGSGTLVLFDPVRARARADDLAREEQDLAEALAGTWGERYRTDGRRPSLFLDLVSELPERLIECPPLPTRPEDRQVEVGTLDATPGDPDAVAAGLSRLVARGIDVVLAMDGKPAAARVARILGEHGLDLPLIESLGGVGRSGIIGEGIHTGVVLPALKLAVLGEREIVGRRRTHRRPGRRRSGSAPAYQDLTPGDYVVHSQHGIGRFDGLASRTIAGVERDYLVIAYAKGDRLYVPTDQLAAVRKYTGGESPRVSRMGGSDWAATRSRVRREAAVVADHVVQIHRARAAAQGHAFAPDTPWQQEVEDAFPYEETRDQLAAIHDVKEDMESPAPMDRLVFGDVGFGKTEVALRASFKAVADGFQVAMLCPTTLLVQQHFQTFSERFDPYPIRVEMLSRFLTPAQARRVVAGIRTGEVDVVIGTHALLSERVEFRKLGLLVVDEEHRFGVKAKDRIKAVAVGVDVLTLTATPIPRTLEMALTGIRDVSHILTPPEDRHPILTYVGPYDARVTSAAIRRELLREGQVFYVHNRVRSIEHAVARLRELVPDARYGVAHGRMSEGRLEQTMLDFWDHRYDVLVATTIIESGLDLPQVNTLIVERADQLGLAQIYQLRGRVGRSGRRAYAYLFHPEDPTLSETAYRRLEAVGEFTDLGSGMHLARRDLEIRGAGSVLGEMQSGHIAAVGFDLYVELVSEAVAERMGTELPSAPRKEVRIDLPVDAHLPEGYVTEQAARLEAYRRLAGADTHAEVDDVAAEWRDRYGPLYGEAERLIEIARLRVEAIRIGIEEIVNLRREVRLAPVDLAQSQEIRLQRLAPRAILRAAQGRLFLPVPASGDLLRYLLDFLVAMWPPPATRRTDPDGSANRP